MAESLLQGDMEVSVVMTVSLFPVPLPKTVHRKCSAEATLERQNKSVKSQKADTEATLILQDENVSMSAIVDLK